MKKMSKMLMASIAVASLVALYAAFLFWQNAASNGALKRATSELEDQKTTMLQLQNKRVLEAINAKKTLGQLSTDIVQWSDIIQRVRKTIPDTLEGPIVEVLSYSGTTGNAIAMNVKTTDFSGDPYSDVAELIEAFDESPYFVNSFVPSISSGLDTEGREVLTFLFNSEYLDDAADLAADKDEGTVTR